MDALGLYWCLGEKRRFFCVILSQSLPCALSSFPNVLKTFLIDLNIQMHIYFSHKWTKKECINLLGLLYKVPHTWWHNTIESCSLTALESEVWNQGTGRAISLWKLWGRFLCLFHLLVTPGIPWLVAASLQFLYSSSRCLLPLCISATNPPLPISIKDTCHRT